MKKVKKICIDLYGIILLLNKIRMCNFYVCNVHGINIFYVFSITLTSHMFCKEIVGYWCYSVLSVDFQKQLNYFLQNMICMFHINAP